MFHHHFHQIWIVFMFIIIRNSHGRQLTVSQGTFGAALGRLVSSTYDSLTKETDGLKPAIDSCTSKISSKVSTCKNCVETLSCDRSSGASGFLLVLQITHPATSVKQSLETTGNRIKDAGKAIYSKYGENAVNALKDGFNSMGGAGRAISTGIQNAAAEAQNAARKAEEAAKTAAKTVKKIFSGWRKRRSLIPEIKLPNFTDEQKRCLQNCPSCSSFLSGNFLTIMGTICGSDLVSKFEALNNKVNKFTKLVKEWKSTAEANQYLLKEIWIDDVTHIISKIVFWKDSSWRTYHPTATINVDPFNIEPAYDAIALYIMNSY